MGKSFLGNQMPNVSKCPHCHNEITSGDVERMAIAEIENGLRKEFSSIYARDVRKAERNMWLRAGSFVFAVALSLLLLAALFIVIIGEDQLIHPAFTFSIAVILLGSALVFINSEFIGNFVETPIKKIDERFHQFKTSRGYNSGN